MGPSFSSCLDLVICKKNVTVKNIAVEWDGLILDGASLFFSMGGGYLSRWGGYIWRVSFPLHSSLDMILYPK